jgi:peptidyl-prolyl cis-trans isomerase SurA
MPFRIRPRLVALAFALFAAAAPVAAQELDRLAAVVNDEAISAVDLEMRIRLALLSSNLPDNMDIRRRIVPQVLRKLVDERLQLQEAKRLKIAVAPEEIKRGIATIERNNRLQQGQLTAILASAGLPIAVMERQTEAEIAWVKVTRLRLMPRVKIGDDEIEDRLELLRANIGHPEYLLAEIVLPVDEPEKDPEVKRLAERIVEQLQQGARFQALAQQFSASASAAKGGDLDWVPHGALDTALADTIENMSKGTVSPAIRTIEGYQVVMLRDRRIAGETGGDVSVALAQALVPKGQTPDAARSQAAEIAASVKSCADIEAVAKERSLPQSGRIGTVKLAELPDALRSAVAGLDVLQASQPIEDQNGFRVIMVCGRSGETGAGLPNREQIREQLENERLDLMGKRYLQELRKTAFVDVRL